MASIIYCHTSIYEKFHEGKVILIQKNVLIPNSEHKNCFAYLVLPNCLIDLSR